MTEKIDRPAIRVGLASDVERYVRTDATVWFTEAEGIAAERSAHGVPVDQRFAADLPGVTDGPDWDTYAGIYGVRPMQMCVPDGPSGGRLATVAGLTWVGVHPDVRRRGVLSAMLRHHFEQTREAGVALSALHASEADIYGRHGYGASVRQHKVTIDRGTTLVAPELETEAARVTTRMRSCSEEGIATRLGELAYRLASRPGDAVFSPDFYEATLDETPAALRGNEPMRILFATIDGEDVGAAVFRRTESWTRSRPDGTVIVRWVGGSPAVRLALLRRLLDLDLTANATIDLVGTDDPLWSWVGPRSGSSWSVDGQWIRLVDLPAALTLRGYAGDCDLTLEVTDEAAPWNAGRWRFVVRDGAAEVAAGAGEPDITLPVSALGAAYLGGTNLVALHRAGLFAERRPGAVADLWRAFGTDLAPAVTPGF